jgi:hypothetical protein
MAVFPFADPYKRLKNEAAYQGGLQRSFTADSFTVRGWRDYQLDQWRPFQ